MGDELKAEVLAGAAYGRKTYALLIGGELIFGSINFDVL